MLVFILLSVVIVATSEGSAVQPMQTPVNSEKWGIIKVFTSNLYLIGITPPSQITLKSCGKHVRFRNVETVWDLQKSDKDVVVTLNAPLFHMVGNNIGNFNVALIASFPSPIVQQITNPVEHAEGPTWDDRKNILYYVDIHQGGVLAYHYDTNTLTRITLNGEVTPVVPARKNPNLLLVGVNRSLVAVEWDGNKELGNQQVLTTVARDHPTSRFNDGKADKQGRLWWGTMGLESSNGDLQMYEGYLYKISKDDILNPIVEKAPVSISNGLAWNKANDKLYYIDTPTGKVVEFVYYDEKGDLSADNRTAFDVAKYPDQITGSPDGMTIDEEDNLWIALYGGGAIVKANPNTGELLKVIPIPARDVTSAMWGGPDLDVLFVTTSRVSLTAEEKMQQPAAGSVFAITNLGTKGLPVFTADIIDGLAKRKPSGGL